jgi:hypothetical protein
MLAYISALVSWLAGRFCSRAELELEVIALRHQLAVLRRQRPGRPQLFALDRLLWVWLYRVWLVFLPAGIGLPPCRYPNNWLVSAGKAGRHETRAI